MNDSNLNPNPTPNLIPTPTQTPQITANPFNTPTDNIYPAPGIISNATTSGKPEKKSDTVPKIIIAIVLVILLAVGGFFLIKNLVKGPKTMAEFEKIMTDLGYVQGQDDTYHYTDTDGSYIMYFMADLNTRVSGVVLFYDMRSKEDLKILAESVSQDESVLSSYINSFDWSKDYNKEGDCYTNKGDAKICQYLIQYDNTILSLFISSNSIDKSKAEVERILSALNY